MIINKIISFQDGWKVLSENKTSQLEDIINSLHLISPTKIEEKILRRIKKDEYIKLNEPKKSRHLRSVPNVITSEWNDFMSKNGWPRKTIKANLFSKNDLFYKHFQKRTSLKLLIINNGMLANWVYIETQKSYEANLCDLSIIIVPMDSYREVHFSGRTGLNSFELLKAQIDDLSPITTDAPFVIIGFSDTESEIEIFDSISNNTNNQINSIDKCIEFSPEQYQAGMGILSYFGEVIKTKHPDIQAKVKIEQNGSLVRLHIETEDGTKEIIEKTLENYTRVIANQEPIETLFDNKLHIMALQNKLEIASMEVRQTRDMLALEREVSSARILSVEEEVLHLRSHIGNQMSIASQNSNIIETQAVTSNKIITELMGSSKMLLKDLIADKSMSSEVLEALDIIDKKLESNITPSDESEIKAAIEIINKNSPDIIDKLSTALKNTAYGVSGNVVYQWLITISNTVC